MTKTAADVGRRALELIGVKPVGEGAAAEDLAVATTTYAALLEEFSDREGMAFEWAADATPEWAFLPFAEIVASRIAPVYTTAYDGSRGERLIRRHVWQDDRVPGQSPGGDFY